MLNNIPFNELFFYFKYPRINKTVKIPDMSLRLKKVCPVYNTYPITEVKMYRLIQWHLCVYRGHTGKCIRRCWYLRVLPVLHRPEVVDIGVYTKKKNMSYA